MVTTTMRTAKSFEYNDGTPDTGRELVIYNARRNPTPAPLFRLFGQLTGTQLTVIDGPYGESAGRLREERDTPQADVVITKSRPDMAALRADELLTPEIAADLPALPDWLRADDGSWVGFSAWPRLAIVNRAVVPNSAEWPTRLEDFADPRWHRQFAVASVLERTTQAHFAALVATRGYDWTADLLDRLLANGMRAFPGNTGLRIAMMAEPFAAALASASNVHVFHYEGNAVGAAWLDQEPGGLGAHIEAHCVGIVRGGPHPEAAREFAAFLLSAEAQRFLAAIYGETPVIADADHGAVRPLSEIRRLDAPLTVITQLMPEAVALLRSKGLDHEGAGE